MTGFVVGAIVTLALTLAVLLRPFYLRRSASATASQRQLNTAILREQLAKLDQDLAEGTLGAEDYGQARAELQRRVLQDTSEADATPTLRAPRRTMAAVGLTVPVVALGMYMLIGNPGIMTADPAGGAHANQQELARMVDLLAKKMEKEPDNLQGWAMLARSYKVLGRSQEAELAFEHAGSFIDNDAQALANYADVAASNAGGNFKGKPAMLIAKALKADPQNAMALWLSGTEAMSRNDYDTALATWGRLLPLLAPGSEDEKMLRGAMEEVRARAGKPLPLAAATPSAATAMASQAQPAGAPPSTAGVSGTVELAPGLKSKTTPSDIVMVIARLPGTRVPLAVMRAQASDLPLKFRLDDSMAMNPQSLISTAREVEVEARVSRTGMAKAEAGDLLSGAQTVKVGAADVTLRVAQVRN
jgi:cytochrome c-type biogenesis protein CcmH